MTHITTNTYTCDRCGHTKNTQPRGWGKIELHSGPYIAPGQEYKPPLHICDRCLIETGLLKARSEARMHEDAT